MLDLGIKQSYRNSYKQLKTSKYYTAPELFFRKLSLDFYTYEKADIFSIGVIAYIMLYGI